MGIPFYPPTSCKVGSFKIGTSLSEFMKKVDIGEIEISDRGGKYPFVNNDTLNNYILKYGGRKERYNEYIHFETNLTLERKIKTYTKLIYKSGYSKKDLKADNIEKTDLINQINVGGFSAKHIIEFYDILKRKKLNESLLNKLYTYGFTDKILEKYYEDKDFDISVGNNLIKPLIIKEKIGNVTFTLGSFHEFCKTYKANLNDFDNIDFLNSSEKNEIIKKANKKFGY